MLSRRSTAVLISASFVAWAVGATVLSTALWSDVSRPTPGDDVGAGLAGLVVAIAFAIFVVSTTIGLVLGLIATRRAPDARSADVALGLNVVTLFGVLLSTLFLYFR
jgi:hypothetical protein